MIPPPCPLQIIAAGRPLLCLSNDKVIHLRFELPEYLFYAVNTLLIFPWCVKLWYLPKCSSICESWLVKINFWTQSVALCCCPSGSDSECWVMHQVEWHGGDKTCGASQGWNWAIICVGMNCMATYISLLCHFLFFYDHPHLWPLHILVNPVELLADSSAVSLSVWDWVTQAFLLRHSPKTY